MRRLGRVGNTLDLTCIIVDAKTSTGRSDGATERVGKSKALRTCPPCLTHTNTFAPLARAVSSHSRPAHPRWCTSMLRPHAGTEKVALRGSWLLVCCFAVGSRSCGGVARSWTRTATRLETSCMGEGWTFLCGYVWDGGCRCRQHAQLQALAHRSSSSLVRVIWAGRRRTPCRLEELVGPATAA